MSTLSQFASGGGIKPSGLINGAGSSFGPMPNAGATGPIAYLSPGYAKTVTTPACTADALVTILSLAGRGVISFLAFQNADATSRTGRMKITLDGVVILDKTTSATTASGDMLPVIGQCFPAANAANGSVVVPEPLTFESSLLIEYASSLTETGKCTIAYRYMPR